MIQQAEWITPARDMGDVCPIFRRRFVFRQGEDPTLSVTSLGVYVAYLNGQRIGNYILAPGWTAYASRLQVQTYPLDGLVQEGENELTVVVAPGWWRSPMGYSRNFDEVRSRPLAVLAQVEWRSPDGTVQSIHTNTDWQVGESPLRFCEIYDGEVYDARTEVTYEPVRILSHPKDILIPQEGEIIAEQERLKPSRMFRTPKGELVLDFGQNMTGYVEFSVTAERSGRVVVLDGAEILDRDGNFYRRNYRGAKSTLKYICRKGTQTYKTTHTFYGFRYIRLKQFPGDPQPEDFTAIVVHSDFKRTGWLSCGVPELNQLFRNIAWGQKGNCVDVPTDCPQRDERLGWTGDAQAFIKTACYQFDMNRFFRKWLRDMAADQHENGAIPMTIPDFGPIVLDDHRRDLMSRRTVMADGWNETMSAGAGWADAACICPWQLYQTYGEVSVLEEQFACMKGHVDSITAQTAVPDHWIGCFSFGDWLGLDAPYRSFRGSSDEELIATAFYAHSTHLLVQTGQILGKDMTAYEQLFDRILTVFQTEYEPKLNTQTEYAVAIQFNLCRDMKAACDRLAELVRQAGNQLRTGFIGTPYLLHALSRGGYDELAYTLLLRRDYPSWLYPVSKGATTVWEHWDGMRPDGSLWRTDMNSFNHYAYGAVADWIYEVAAGLRPAKPGFSEIVIAPHPDRRMGSLDMKFQSPAGLIAVSWAYHGNKVSYTIETPVPATVIIDGVSRSVSPGKYTY